MVSNAQLDNDKQALSYQVDYLKDRLGDEEENVLNLKDELSLLTREYNSIVRKNERNLDEIEKMKYILSERDRILEEYGINPDGTRNPEHEESQPATSLPNGLDTTVLDAAEASSIDKAASYKSQSSVSSTTTSEDREALLEQIKTLKDEVAELRKDSDSESFQIQDAAVEELRRELQKSSADYRLKVQKLEQENARLEGSAIRLEAQVKRYKTQAESAEATEDSLLAEKRKVGRELRQAQEVIMELETEKEQLQKRVDKLKSRRKDDY